MSELNCLCQILDNMSACCKQIKAQSTYVTVHLVACVQERGSHLVLELSRVGNGYRLRRLASA